MNSDRHLLWCMRIDLGSELNSRYIAEEMLLLSSMGNIVVEIPRGAPVISRAATLGSFHKLNAFKSCTQPM